MEVISLQRTYNDLRCASCGMPILPSETAYDCPVYGHRHWLCKGCNDEQERNIDYYGSNRLAAATHSIGGI